MPCGKAQGKSGGHQRRSRHDREVVNQAIGGGDAEEIEESVKVIVGKVGDERLAKFATSLHCFGIVNNQLCVQSFKVLEVTLDTRLPAQSVSSSTTSHSLGLCFWWHPSCCICPVDDIRRAYSIIKKLVLVLHRFHSSDNLLQLVVIRSSRDQLISKSFMTATSGIYKWQVHPSTNTQMDGRTTSLYYLTPLERDQATWCHEKHNRLAKHMSRIYHMSTGNLKATILDRYLSSLMSYIVNSVYLSSSGQYQA